MQELKINFVDFWPNYEKRDNFFYNILSKKYRIIISDNPDVIIYSCFGHDYLNYSCKRIFYTGENIRPDFTACDFAFSFDYSNKKNHYRLPLYLLYIDSPDKLNEIQSKKSDSELKQIWIKKNKFFCMVVSSPKSKFRLKFFKAFSKFRTIDSGGKMFNNIGGRVKDKIEFINNYKFVMAFENSSYPGYTTEKILEPMFVNSIPVYWGNKHISKDFNPKRFINYSDYNSEKELYNHLEEIENNENLAISILKQPIFSSERPSFEDEKHLVLNVLIEIIESSKKPIAIRGVKYLHSFKLLVIRIFNKIIIS